MAERLPGADAMFLYLETPSQHMHTLKIAILDTSHVPGGYDLQLLRGVLSERLPLLPPFRRRIVEVPWRLHHPVWVEDDAVDAGAHLRRRQVPLPGTLRELEQVIGDIASTPLDRSRPLWEMTICEGLADGRVAVVTKMHHAIADGMAANALLSNITDTAIGSARTSVGRRVSQLHDAGMVGAALRDWGHDLRALPALLAHTGRAVAAVVRLRRSSHVSPPRPILDTPRVPFDGALTPRRSFATATIPLAAAKTVKNEHGVTLNDVVLAVVGGALRAYLDARDALPATSLTAGVPVSTDPRGGSPRLVGNRTSNLFVTLGTDLEDPAQRLRAVAAVTREAKRMQDALGLEMLQRWVQFTPPAPFSAFMRFYSRLRLANQHPSPFNVVVSNVPGPTEPVVIGGAEITDLYSVGPVLEGMGLNITVWSYVDRLNFSLLTCPDLLPDLDALAALLPGALQELLATTGASLSTAAG